MQGRNQLANLKNVASTGNASDGHLTVKNVQLQIAICKLNEKLQREQEGRAGEEYTQCHSNP